jgi:hypothetical protein
MMMMMMIAWTQGTTENSYVGHSTHTWESTNVESQKSLILKTVLYAPWIVAQNSYGTVYLRNMVCFRNVSVNTLNKGDNVIIIIIIIIIIMLLLLLLLLN